MSAALEDASADSELIESSAISSGWVRASGQERVQPRRERVEPVAILYPLTRLSGNRMLARSLVVVVEAEGDSVVMNSPSLRVWGVGADLYEAFSDFSSSLVGAFDSYQSTPRENLTPGAVEYLELLQSYLGR